MKKLVILILILGGFTSCKEDTKTASDQELKINESTSENTIKAKESDGLRTLVGQFIYYGDAAVLQTRNDIYGVVINKKMLELNDMAKAYKKDETDYVTVQVRGKLVPKPENEEGWPFRIDIKTIDSVKEYIAKDNEVIKLGNDTTE